MTHKFAEIAFTDTVRRVQEEMGSRKAYQRFDEGADVNDRLGANETAFIASRDSFYMATVTETGWPYIQHRGGPAGFVRVLDQRTLGFADFRGNRQYVTVGNLRTDDRVSLFFMDYANRARLKLFGRAAATDDPETLAQLTVPGYRAKVERGLLILVEGFDWNCPQHITERFTLAEVEGAVDTYQRRIAELERRIEAAGLDAG